MAQAIVSRLVPGVAVLPEQGSSRLPAGAPPRGWLWADLMRGVFALDVPACSRCCGSLRLIAVLEASDATARNLRHLTLQTAVPLPAPARAPPGVDDWAA